MFSTLNKSRAQSLSDARHRAVLVWGNRVPHPLLFEWADLWWCKRDPIANPSTVASETRAQREITLSDLKIADELEALLTRLNIRLDDLLSVVKLIGDLGGFGSASAVVEELRKLRNKRPADQPSLFDGAGLSELEDQGLGINVSPIFG